MPNTPGSSFIPRQGPAKRTRQVSRQIHLFTVLSYVLFFGVLSASAGVFFYDRHIEAKRTAEITTLNAATANFSDEKMEEVRAFNARLIMARDRLNNTVALSSVFESLEDSSAQSINLESLELKRVADDRITLALEARMDDFDSSLFQRGLYERNPIIETVAFEDVGLGEKAEEEGAPEGVSFKAEIVIPAAEIPYEAGALPVVPVVAEIVATTSVSTASSSEAIDESNTSSL